MKSYLAITGSLFALLAGVHVWRIVAEWPGVVTDTGARIEAAVGIVAVGLCVWAWRLYRVTPS